MQIDLHFPARDDMVRGLHDRLAASGQALREGEYETILLSVTNSDGERTAGCKGEICFTSAHISELWEAERHRGAGLGSRLLIRAEEVARDKACNRIHLETRNEAARRLYEKLGYTVFGQLPNYAASVPLYYLQKDLT